MRCISIKVSTQAVGFGGDLVGGAPMRSFEQRVFNEMANPVERRRFVARASAYPNPETNGAKARHMFRQNRETVCESSGLNLIYHHAFIEMTGLSSSESIVTRGKGAAKWPLDWV